MIEGQRTLVIERRPPLPQKLDVLLGSLVTTYAVDIRPGGARAACEARQHRFFLFRRGRHLGTDAVVRDLSLEMCADCGAVAVHDIGLDRLPGLPTGRQAVRRRDRIIGWYSGARRNHREYR